MSRKDDILGANALFYEAFRAGDYVAMEELWSRTRRVSAYHPGWMGILGREEVMASWFQVMVLSPPPDVHACNATVIVSGNTGLVFCTEVLGDSAAIASNSFVLEDGRWQMVHHQVTPLPGRFPDKGDDFLRRPGEDGDRA